MSEDKTYILALIMLIPLLLSATLYVDEDYVNPLPPYFNEIQAAIDYASNGETIIVYEASDGYYDEELEIHSIYLTIQSAEDNEVVVRGQDGVTLDIAYTNGTVTIDGLILMNTDEETVLHVESGYSPTIIIQNCVFDDSNDYMIDIEQAYPVYIYDNSFCRSSSGSEDLVKFGYCITEAEISGNTFRNTTGDALNITNSDDVLVFDNVFKDCSTCIHYNNTTNYRNISIYRNLIYDSIYGSSDAVMIIQGYSDADIYNNTFVSNDSVTPIPALLDCNSFTYTDINVFENNIMLGYRNFVDVIPGNFPNNIDFNCYDGTIPYPGDHNITSDPEFVDPDNDDYNLTYYSPCIDAGDRVSDYDDEDGSLADIGYVQHEQYINEWPIFSSPPFSYRSSWNWICLAKLPVDPNDENDNIGQNINADTLRWHWNEVPDSCGWFNETCGANPWFYGLDDDNDEFFDEWSNDDPDCPDSLNSVKGYKIYRTEDAANLFTRGKECEEDADLSTAANADTWVGYFIPDTQSAEDALPSAVLNDCVKIQTQRWATSRATTGDPWSSDPDDLYLNYADMVVLETTSAHSFSWESSRGDTEPIIRPYALHFEWEEEVDYLPVYVEFDPEDVPDEIGIFVDDICQGAEVVEGLNCQICTYILFEESGQEIEFEFWYEGRGEKERRDSYQIHENGYPVVTNTLFTGQPGEFYTLSFNKGESIEPVPYNFCCYPNPFNPETTISFELDKEVNVELVVYNIRGQKIKTLANETFRPDTYSIMWNGDNDNGNKVSSGVYFVRLKIDNDIHTNKVIMLK